MLKVLAYLQSKQIDGKNGAKEEVELIDAKTENGITHYIIKTSSGLVCSAIHNVFTNSYYADDVYGIIKENKKNIQM